MFFISYTRSDYVDADKNVIPGNPISVIKDAFDKAGITYWFDEDGVYAGDTFAPVIARAIHSYDIFLCVSSERSNSSEWTSNEATAMEGSFGTQKEHYGLRKLAARIKSTEILLLFFGIHTANVVNLARREYVQVALAA